MTKILEDKFGWPIEEAKKKPGRPGKAADGTQGAGLGVIKEARRGARQPRLLREREEGKGESENEFHRGPPTVMGPAPMETGRLAAAVEAESLPPRELASMCSVKSRWG